MKRLFTVVAVLAVLTSATPTTSAFCGFYVAKADTGLFNKASQVVIARHDDRTVLTMANDFRGDPTEFAIVIPVPTFITEEQIHVADRALIEHLDAYSSPRLVEYFDGNPCEVRRERFLSQVGALRLPAAPSDARARSLGVAIEAEYTVGEYDIVLLSATQSDGLVTWLTESGYRMPEGAAPVLGSYMKQGMRFFLAKVNLEEQSKLGFSYLRPLQVAYESPKFMLPIRLGTLNADGEQELFIYTLTRKGRVETTNYRTVKLPTGMDLPIFVKEEFSDFYRDMFTEQVRRERGRAVFLEYAWNMAWCDPCAADPLSREQLQELGVFWLDGSGGQAQDVFVTRLHVRYDRKRFPEDLIFQETADNANFQARYVLRHPWTGDESCSAADSYHESLPTRWQTEAETLAGLTGWSIDAVREAMADGEAWLASRPVDQPWWKRIWSN